MFSNMKLAILFLLIGIAHGRPQWWWDNFEKEMEEMGKNIERNMNEMEKNMEKNMNDMEKNLENMGKDLEVKFNNVAPGGFNSISNSVNGANNVNIHGANFSYHSSEGTRNGVYFFDEIKEEVINGVIHRTERHYNPATKEIETTKYTKSATDRNAQFVRV